MMSLFSFPHPVNELAARSVAAGVVALGTATLLLSLVDEAFLWLLVPLAYGFVARVASGPRFSPLGQLATRVVAPRLGEPRLTGGPPKRFAQAIGAGVSLSAGVLALAGAVGGAQVLLAGLVVAASLEALFGLCLGCKAFALLMRTGLIPASTCQACNDISVRSPSAAV